MLRRIFLYSYRNKYRHDVVQHSSQTFFVSSIVSGIFSCFRIKRTHCTSKIVFTAETLCVFSADSKLALETLQQLVNLHLRYISSNRDRSTPTSPLHICFSPFRYFLKYRQTWKNRGNSNEERLLVHRCSFLNST